MKRGRQVVPHFSEYTGPGHPHVEEFEALTIEMNSMYRRMAGQVPGQTTIISFEDDCNRLKSEVDCYQNENAALKKQLSKLLEELENLKMLLQEECKRRQELECCAASLKQQINDMDVELCVITADREMLKAKLEELEKVLEEYKNALRMCQIERDDLCRKISAHEATILRNGETKCNFQNTLADSCSKIDAFAQQIGCLQAELNRVNRDKEDLMADRDELARKYACLQEKFRSTKCVNDEIIIKLQEEVRCLQEKLENACKRFQDIIKLHHDELDRLSKELQQWKDMYNKERLLREELEKKLRECEARKGGMGPAGTNCSGPEPGQMGANCCDQSGQVNNLLEAKRNLEYRVCQLTIELDNNHVHKDVLESLKREQDNKIREIQKTFEDKLKKTQELRQKQLEEDDLNNNTSASDSNNNQTILLIEEQLRASREEKNSLQKSLQDLASEKARLKEELQRLKTEIAEVKEMNVALKTLLEKETPFEAEVAKLKASIQNNLVERTELENLSRKYERELTLVQNRYDAQLEMNNQLADINEQLGKQFSDREMIKALQDSNEELLRKELHAVVRASRADTERMSQIIRERDSEINGLRKAFGKLRDKYSAASQRNEELAQQVKILSSTNTSGGSSHHHLMSSVVPPEERRGTMTGTGTENAIQEEAEEPRNDQDDSENGNNQDNNNDNNDQEGPFFKTKRNVRFQ